ncbi:MAG: DUF342 domain-containing protein [Candidatus Hydrogenedentes bacterium]|nr:DUF342 domain-containing protein [Candidatus Hydrogenedentota bacterium]
MERNAPQQASEVPPEPRRTNLRLREALDLFLSGQYEKVTDRELGLLRDTLDQLLALEDPAPNHLRLKDLIEQVLANHEVLQTAEAAVRTEEAAAAPAAEDRLAVAAVLAQARKEQVRDLDDIPVSLSCLVFRHKGTLVIEGDVPDNLLVEARGGLRVEGFLFGHALAGGKIQVRENIQGGWVVSRRGDVQAGRVLAGSRVIAPRGAVRADQIQNAAMVFAADIAVSDNLLGGAVYCRSLKVGGAIVSAKLQVLREVTAGAIESQGGDSTVIVFPSVITSQVYGQPLDDALLISLATVSRQRYRTEVWRQLTGLTRRHVRRLHQLALFALSPAGVSDKAALTALHDGAALSYYGAVLLAGADALQRVVHEAVALGADVQVPIINAGVEESCLIGRLVEKELEQIGKTLADTVQNRLVSECRHLTNSARKLRETAIVKGPLDKVTGAIDRRLRELQSVLAATEADMARREPTLAGALGQKLIQEEDLELLAAEVFTRAEMGAADTNTQPVLQDALFQQIRVSAARHLKHMEQWEEAIRTSPDPEKAHESPGGAGIAIYPPLTETARRAAAGRFSAGTTLTLHTLVSQGDGQDSSGSYSLRLRETLETPAAFVIENGRFRPTPWTP